MDSVLEIIVVLLFAVVVCAMVGEVGILWRAWREAPEVVALRERVIAASCRTAGITILMGLVINRLFLDVLSPDVIGLLGGIGVAILAIPAARFLYLYMRGGFHELPRNGPGTGDLK